MFAQRSYDRAPLGAQVFPGGVDGMNCLATALDEINEGAIFLDSDAKLIWHNRAFDKLMVDNSEGHLLVAAVIDLASDFAHENEGLTVVAGGPGPLVSRNVKIGGIIHDIHCTIMPKGLLGPDTFLLTLVKRSASRWSSYEQHLRNTWNLTEREAQVAVECLQGKKNLEIADHLRISVETVNKHLDKVYQKASVRGRAELASRLLDSAV
jgi:DNA-binding CsgD family transcriptional regulator